MYLEWSQGLTFCISQLFTALFLESHITRHQLLQFGLAFLKDCLRKLVLPFKELLILAVEVISHPLHLGLILLAQIGHLLLYQSILWH